MTRIGRLQRYLKGTMQMAVAEVGIQDFEYETLHSLMIRDTPAPHRRPTSRRRSASRGPG